MLFQSTTYENGVRDGSFFAGHLATVSLVTAGL